MSDTNESTEYRAQSGADATALPEHADHTQVPPYVGVSTPDAADAPGPRPDDAAGGSALRRWARRAPVTTMPPVAVRLGPNPEIVVPFTTDDFAVDVHFVDYPELRGYVRCSGAGCLICEVKKKPEPRFLLPVYHPSSGSVAVLPVPSSLRPGALGPALAPAVEQLEAGARLSLEITKTPQNTYEVNSLPILPGAPSGAAEVARFRADLDAGRVNLEDAYPSRTRAELLRIPGLAAEARMRGIES